MTQYFFFNRKIALSLYEALAKDPFYITMANTVSPDHGKAREGMLKYLDYAMKEARDNGELTLNHNLGASIWSTPLKPCIARTITEQKKNFIRENMGDAALAAYGQISVNMARGAKDLVSSHFWYLSILGIRPGHQGKGLGKTLVSPVLEKADAARAPIYIETFTPENFGFYESLGFYQAKTVDEPITGSKYTIMIRDAS